MRSTRLGWAMAGEDPAVNELQARVAQLAGKESALFVPTGTMANLVALMTHATRGQQVVLESSSHILWGEEWGLSALCGLHHRALEGVRGAMPVADVRAAIVERRFGHRPQTALLCLENTHNMAGGAVLSPEYTDAVSEVAHEHDVPVHIDGARILNAGASLGIELIDLVRSVDSVSINLNKGLSAPMGAVLCGNVDFVTRARGHLKRLGGWSISQAGIVAAAGLVALDHMRVQLADDNRRARRLADAIGGRAGFRVEPCETNIVMVEVTGGDGMTAQLLRWLEHHGVRVYGYRPNCVRLVTHRHIDDSDVEAIVAAFTEFDADGTADERAAAR